MVVSLKRLATNPFPFIVALCDGCGSPGYRSRGRHRDPTRYATSQPTAPPSPSSGGRCCRPSRTTTAIATRSPGLPAERPSAWPMGHRAHSAGSTPEYSRTTWRLWSHCAQTHTLIVDPAGPQKGQADRHLRRRAVMDGQRDHAGAQGLDLELVPPSRVQPRHEPILRRPGHRAGRCYFLPAPRLTSRLRTPPP